jgi:hypothetical protein
MIPMKIKADGIKILFLILAGILLWSCSSLGDLLPAPTTAPTAIFSPTDSPAPSSTPTLTLTPTITQTPTPSLKGRILYICDNYRLDTHCRNGKAYYYYLYRYGDRMDIEYTLSGDIEGNVFDYCLSLDGYDKTDFVISILIRQNGTENLFGKAEIPDIDNYMNYDLFRGAIRGEDPETSVGDQLILRVEKFHGMIGSLRITNNTADTSYITLP